jgi:hypothetical protein
VRFGGFFLRDFDFGIDDGLLYRRQSFIEQSSLRRFTGPPQQEKQAVRRFEYGDLK